MLLIYLGSEPQNVETAHVRPEADRIISDAFSKKLDNHKAMIALHYMHYNFSRIHKTLRATPAVEAGKAEHVWSLEEIVALAV